VDPRWWAEQCARLEMPYDAFITWNEPTDIYNNITLEMAAWHDDWCCEFRNRIIELGYQAVALNVPTGHFHRNAVVNLFPDVCQEFRYIGLHEYSARVMWDQDPKKQRPPEEVPRNEGELIGRWYCQRYRDWHDGIVARWPEREGKFQMVATECGVAYGVMPGWGDVGWRTDLSVDQYVASLRWYFEGMNRDDYCLGGAIFMMGFADHKWASFETLGIWQRLLEIPEAEAPGPPAPPPAGNGGDDMNGIKVIDLEYNERDFEYARSKYGVAYRRAVVEPGQKVYRLVELWEKTGTSGLGTQVLDEGGEPIADADVAFYWPDAPEPPDPPTEVYPHDWHENFVHGPTNENGDVAPGMGHGAYHGEGEGGPHAVWVRDPSIPSDICEKLGMLAGTFHDHLDQKFHLMVEPEDGGEPEPPGPEPPPDAESVGEFIAGVKAKVDQDVKSARYGPDGWEFEFYG
jgi:hypothetical protein